MLIDDSTALASYKKSNRTIGDMRIYHSSGSYSDPYAINLVKFTIERDVPSGKFFGYSVGQKITAEFLGNRSGLFQKGNYFRFCLWDTVNNTTGYKDITTNFYIESTVYDDATKTTTVTGYDYIGRESFSTQVFSDSNITYPVTLYEFTSNFFSTMSNCTFSADFTGVNPTIEKSTLNLDGTETRREILNAIAEATGTICYTIANGTNTVFVFRTLAKGSSSEVDDSFDGSNYFDFTSDSNGVKLTRIISATELGDNVSVGNASGYTQIIRDNPFLVLRSDISSRLSSIYSKVNDTTIIPHTLNFRGNPYYEIGDLLSIARADGVARYIHYLSGTFTYDGGINATSEWEAGVNENVNATPTKLGDAISQTYAKVDKANKQIDLMVSQVEDAVNYVDEQVSSVSETIGQITVKNDSILQTVENNTKYIDSSIDNLTSDINSISQKVSQTITSEQMEIAIETKIQDVNVEEVTTVTGFTFNADGLTISKTGTEMSTNIDEDGMTVYRSGQQILVADSTGVDATNLRASTYLIIGENSRFEDYGSRTACFWIGG